MKAPHIILATGARARQLPGLEADGKLIWTYKEAMVPQAMPKSLLVIGSGAIGIEFASFYLNMGAEVTVVEVLDRILPVEDEEISAFAKKAFEKQRMKIVTGAAVKGLKKNGDSVTVTVEAGGKTQEITVDRVISAVGIVGNVGGYRARGHEDPRREDACRRSTNSAAPDEPGIYAIGDLCGPPWLAHKASHEGVVCVEKIAGLNDVHPIDWSQHPGLHLLPPAGRLRGLHRGGARRMPGTR